MTVADEQVLYNTGTIPALPLIYSVGMPETAWSDYLDLIVQSFYLSIPDSSFQVPRSWEN